MDCNKYISLEDQIIDSEYLACSCCLKHMSESLCTQTTPLSYYMCVNMMKQPIEYVVSAYIFTHWYFDFNSSLNFYEIVIVTHLSDEEIEFHRG